MKESDYFKALDLKAKIERLKKKIKELEDLAGLKGEMSVVYKVKMDATPIGTETSFKVDSAENVAILYDVIKEHYEEKLYKLEEQFEKL